EGLVALAVAVERARVPLREARIVRRLLDALGEELLALGVLAEHELATRHDDLEALLLLLLQPVRPLELLGLGDRVADAAGIEGLFGVVDGGFDRDDFLRVRRRREEYD